MLGNLITGWRPPRRPTAPADEAPSYADEVTADAPVLWWRLGEASGTTAVNDGSVTGNGAYTDTTITLGEPGLIAGEDTCVKLFGGWVSGSATAADLGIDENVDRTIECWLKVDAAGAGLFRVPWSVGGASAPSCLYIGCNPGSATAWEVGLWGAATTFVMPDPVGSARHVVLTYAGATRTFRIYVDGALVKTYVHSADLTTTGTAQFDGGYLRAAGGNFWAGWLDELAVYPSVLSAERILAHYQTGTRA